MAPSATTTTASAANYFTGVDNDTRFYTAGIMYETGPWQMSFLWAGFYNTNGNGSASVSSITPGTNARCSTLRPRPVSRASTARTSTAILDGAIFGSKSAQKVRNRRQLRARTGHQGGRRHHVHNVGGPTNAVSGNNWVVLLGMDLRF